MSTTATSTAWSTKNKVGLGLAIVYGVLNLPSFLTAAPEGETGPPLGIMILCSVLGLVVIVAGVMAWRTVNRPAARLAAASVIVITLTSLPAFFVDVPAWLKLGVGVTVLLALAAVVLMFTPDRQPAAVPAMD